MRVRHQAAAAAARAARGRAIRREGAHWVCAALGSQRDLARDAHLTAARVAGAHAARSGYCDLRAERVSA